jgi:hypothetical protein
MRVVVHRLRHLALLVIMLGSFLLVRAGIDDKSPTEDEWAHFTRGIAFWQTGDTRLSFAHPPLANAWATIGLADAPEVPDLTQTRGWQKQDPGAVALAWLKTDYDTPRALLLEARRAMTWIFMLGIAYVYFFCHRMLGFRAAVVASTLVAFNPICIGQAAYVTTDLAAAVAITIAAGELARHLAGDSRIATWITMPLSLGAALLTKHSAVLLVPLFVLVVFVVAVQGVGRFAGRRRSRRFLSAGGHALYSAAFVLLCLNAGFRFDATHLTAQDILERPEPQYWISSPYDDRLLEEKTPLPSLPASLRIPVPYTYLFGVACIRAQNERGFPQAHFFGERTPHGHVAYFPTLIALKTPLAVFALLLLGVVVIARDRRWPSLALGVIAAIALGYLLASMRSQLNMGVRHALPVIWGISIVAGAAFGAAWVRLRDHLVARGLLVLLPASVVLVGATTGPDPIGYFNELVGRERGHDIAAYGDDWGQDRMALAELVERHDLQPLWYDAQTSTRRLEADWLGLRYEALSCRTTVPHGSWVAIHRVTWNNNHHRCWRQVREREPVFVVNDHVLVFWIP